MTWWQILISLAVIAMSLAVVFTSIIAIDARDTYDEYNDEM